MTRNSLAMTKYLGPYKAAVGEGAVLELKLRVLANQVHELRKYAHAQKLEEVEAAIIAHYGARIAKEEAEVLERCRALRNKILHCNFRVARQKLAELGTTVQPAGIKTVDVRGLSGKQMREKVERMVAGVQGTFEYVADSAAAADDIYVWLLEAGEAGDFDEAVRIFAKASAILDRLAGARP